jgi:rhodanese-related sulfurtransferase
VPRNLPSGKVKIVPMRDYPSMIKTVSVHELSEQLDADSQSVLIDVRCPQEFDLGHVSQARNIPLGSMPLKEIVAEWSREAEGKPIYFICRSGGRSQELLDELAQIGFDGAQCVAGGMVAWQAMGLPIMSTPAPTVMTLRERRSRLAAGLLVLLGCGLGFLVHCGFFAIAVLTGAELAFAGLTGWYGLSVVFGRGKTNR